MKDFDRAEVENRLAKLNEELNELYGKLGKKTYREFQDNPPVALQTEIREIREVQEAIDDAEYYTLAMDGITHCQNCNTVIYKNATFCPKCGAKQDLQSHATCKYCGNVIPENAKFCISCGKAVAEDPIVPVEKPTEDTPEEVKELVHELHKDTAETSIPEKPQEAFPVSNAQKPVNQPTTPPAAPSTPKPAAPAGKIQCQNCKQYVDSKNKFCVYCGKPLH